MLKKVLLSIGVFVFIVFSTVFWIFSLLPEKKEGAAIALSSSQNISYLSKNIINNRGKILAVVTSTDTMGETGKKTGYELTELSRAYWVFTANGFDVDIASPKGGKSPMIKDDMGRFDYAFLNDQHVQAKINNTLNIENVNPEDYEAVYFVGGKGAMFDFPDNAAIKHLVKTLFQNKKVVAAICHGPAALVNVKLDNGDWLAKNRKVSSFTNDEELFLIPDANKIFPFLLQDKLMQQGAMFEAGFTYLEQVSRDDNLITGQNPWSVWSLAEEVISSLGYIPKPRMLTPEEQSINLLKTYETYGFDVSEKNIDTSQYKYNRAIVVMHAVVAFMKWSPIKGFELLMLANALKNAQE